MDIEVSLTGELDTDQIAEHIKDSLDYEEIAENVVDTWKFGRAVEDACEEAISQAGDSDTVRELVDKVERLEALVDGLSTWFMESSTLIKNTIKAREKQAVADYIKAITPQETPPTV
jgi:hypothetical protein